MTEETYRPWKAAGLALAGLVVLAVVLHLVGFAVGPALIPALVVFAAGVLTRALATTEVRLLDGVAALAFGMALAAIAASQGLYAVCAPPAVATVPLAATRLVR